MRYAFAVALSAVGLSASWATAQVRAGDEFQVNAYATGYQGRPSLATDAAGNFVVVWQSDGQDGSYSGVFGQRYDGSGTKQGIEFQANTYWSDPQVAPSVASDAAGNFVVIWNGAGLGDYYGVFGQRFDAWGACRGTEFQVNTYTTSAQRYPSVASDAAGNFVVAWMSYKQDGDGSGIFAQRFDASGARRGTEFQVNTHTTGNQRYGPSVASDPAGNFVVAWASDGQDGSLDGVFAQRYEASGAPRGSEFQVNSFTPYPQRWPSVAADAAGNFVVAWQSFQEGANGYGIFAQRFDSAGSPLGSEFHVNTYTPGAQVAPSVASDAAGSFIVTWASTAQDGSDRGVFAQRYDAAGLPRGAEFRVNTYTTGSQSRARVASDPVGNLVVAWTSDGQDGSSGGVFAQRYYGTLAPARLAVDTVPSSSSDGNDVLEPGESVRVAPSWSNVSGATQTFDGVATSFTGPPASGVSYELMDAAATYGTVPDGGTTQCGDCYGVAVGFAGTRPSTHWDAALVEQLTEDAVGHTKTWSLHIGDSFSDVPRSSGYYRYVETLLHEGVTAGCGGDSYCPTNSTSRQQMAIFTLLSKEGAGYSPPPCGATPIFGDVPVASSFCSWVEELSRRGVTNGCGGGNFCPTAVVQRDQMAAFVLRTLDPSLDPPACGTPVFSDVPANSPFCKYVEELVRRGVVSGCGGGNYCPANPVTRGQVSVFLTRSFGLTLYGP